MNWKPTVVAIGLGALIGFAALSIVQPRLAHSADEMPFEVDPDKSLDETVEEINRVMAENPGLDLILYPSKKVNVVPPEQRREEDARRAAEQDRASAEWIEEQLAAGNLVESAPPTCTSAPDPAPTRTVRFIYCGSALVPIDGTPPTDLSELGAALRSGPLTDLFTALPSDLSTLGYWSAFDTPVDRPELQVNSKGDLVLDFNGTVLSVLKGPDMGSYTAVRQIYATFFQFAEVNSIQLRLDGDCERIGDVLESGCFTMTRDLWDAENEVNRILLPDPITLGTSR